MNNNSSLPTTTIFGESAASIFPPDNTDWVAGVVPNYTLPAGWFNYFMNLFTKTNVQTVADVNSLLTECKAVLTAAGITVNPVMTNQLYTAIQSLIDYKATGKQPFHGVLARPVVGSPLPTFLTTSTFTLSATAYPITYYYNSTPVVVSTDKTCSLGTAGLYFICFNASTGNILSTTIRPAFTFSDNVTIATVLWNGVDYGLVSDERHSYDDNLPWHTWAHKNIGCVYNSGLALTATGTGATSTLALTAGEVDDEDIQFAIGSQTTCRQFWATSASVLAFDKVARATPMRLGANSRPSYVNGSTYVLTEMTSSPNRYVNVFFYATTDLGLPLSMVVETLDSVTAANNGYTSTDLARAAPFPNLSAYGVGREVKAIFRIIVRADGVVQSAVTSDDVRLNSPIPVGGSSGGVSASSVSFNPAGGITSTNMQAVAEELATKKADVVALPQYDLVIDSNAKFLSWQTSGTWPKVLIRTGTWTLASGGIDLTARGTKAIVGESGSQLLFANTDKGLYYTSLPTDSDHYIRDVAVSCAYTGSSTGFTNCTNLTNCTAIGNGTVTGVGLYGCSNLNGCIGQGTGTDTVNINNSGYGFSSCTNLNGCVGTGTGTGGSVQGDASGLGAGAGFFNCSILSHCIGKGYASNTTASATLYLEAGGFFKCSYLSNCNGTGTSTGTATVVATVTVAGWGFFTCDHAVNCKGTGSGTGTGTPNSAGAGYGFFACTNVTSCIASATGIGTGLGAGYGYTSCYKMQQNSYVNPITTAVFYQSYASTGTANPCADTAVGGYNL
jgi:hypothetical protein